MAESRAWLLSLESDMQTAAGQAEVAHFLEQPRLFDVPGTPFYCHQVALWEHRILPVMDLMAWMQNTTQVSRHEKPYVAIAAYQNEPGGRLQYGGLLLTNMPEQITVDDEQACQLPQTPATWRDWQALSIACFTKNDKAVPILDLPYIFSTALSTI